MINHGTSYPQAKHDVSYLCIFLSISAFKSEIFLFPYSILHYFSDGLRSETHTGFNVWFSNSLLAFHFIELYSALQETALSSTKQVCSVDCDLQC